MMSKSEARIYLEQQRGRVREPGVEHLCLFNYGDFHMPHREGFGNLTTFNEEVLDASAAVSLAVVDDKINVIIPVVGSLIVFDGAARNLDPGQILFRSRHAGDALLITNPFRTEAVTFLHLVINVENPPMLDEIVEVDLIGKSNELLTVASPLTSRLSLGKFDGRHDAMLPLLNPAYGAFVFVLEGAFEVENRLLQRRDGLAIWNADAIEFEALSNDAILLVIEDSYRFAKRSMTAAS